MWFFFPRIEPPAHPPTILHPTLRFLDVLPFLNNSTNDELCLRGPSVIRLQGKQERSAFFFFFCERVCIFFLGGVGTSEEIYSIYTLESVFRRVFVWMWLALLSAGGGWGVWLLQAFSHNCLFPSTNKQRCYCMLTLKSGKLCIFIQKILCHDAAIVCNATQPSDVLVCLMWCGAGVCQRRQMTSRV